MSSDPDEAGPGTSDEGSPWWTSAVVYQVYPRSFADSDGDGIGDLPGLISRLDHLNRLGVDVVWVSPFYPSPQADNGYDISDYRDVDPVFGTLADVDELIAQLHARGMRLVIDVVVNHTSDEHPWFVASRSGSDDPRRDWYWWRPAREGHEPGSPGAEPTNWASVFSPSAWELDEATGEYYLHLFDPKQPDLNWENPEVRREVHEMLRWWLARGVDGFRMDVINYVSKRLPLVDVPTGPGRPYGPAGSEFMDGPRIHEFLHELHEAVIGPHGEKLLVVGEMPGTTVEEARLYTDPARAEVDMVFQFEHVDLDRGPGGWFDRRSTSVLDLKRSLGRWQEGLAEVGWNSLYWNNHDQPRVVSRFGNDEPVHRVHAAKALATVLHLHRGTPFVYQGEELGMTNYPFAGIDEVDDVESRHNYSLAVAAGMDEDTALATLRRVSRDNGRTPMQWDASPNAGFTTGTPWLAVNPNHAEINAAAQVHDQHSVFAHYRALIRLRHDLPVVAVGSFRMLLPDDAHLYCFERRLGDERLVVLANLSDAKRRAELAGADLAGARLLLGTHDDGAGGLHALELRPWEARIYRTAGPVAVAG